MDRGLSYRIRCLDLESTEMGCSCLFQRTRHRNRQGSEKHSQLSRRASTLPGQVSPLPRMCGHWCRGVSWFLGFLNRQPRPSPDVFEPRKAKLLLSRPDITTENVIERIFSTLVWWIVLRIVLGLLYNAASFIGVATLLTAPHDWPPYFGSPTSAYTLRKFWA